PGGSGYWGQAPSIPVAARGREHARAAGAAPADAKSRQTPSLTASVIRNSAGFAGRHVTTRASRKAPGESDDEASSDGRDRGRNVAFGSDWRRLGVGNPGEWQIARAARRKVVLRGEWRLVRRSGSRRRRYRVRHDDGSAPPAPFI